MSDCGYDVHVGRLIHMNGRVYDPKLSRFLSPDPLVQNPANSQNWNRYSYVLNNPLKYTDPSGYAVCGSGLSAGQCAKAQEDAERARQDAKVISKGIKEITAKMKDGKELTSEEKATVALIKEKFGDDFASAKNLNKLANGFDSIVNKIGEAGEGVTLEAGNNQKSDNGDYVPEAYVKTFHIGDSVGFSSNTINLNNGYLNKEDPAERQRLIIHEAAHVARKFGDHYWWDKQDNIRGHHRKVLSNADTYACVTYPENCK